LIRWTWILFLTYGALLNADQEEGSEEIEEDIPYWFDPI
jgi:hypothetical protein